MTDDELFELVKRVDPLAVRLPPGIKEIAIEIAKVEREACALICDMHTVDDVLVGVGISQSCAAMIRARSNAALTGAAKDD